MSEPDSNPEKRIALFQQKEIRRVIHNNEWWFVIIDVVAALTDSANPKGYFTDMRRRDPQLGEALKGGANCHPLGLEFDTAGGRQMLQCWNTEGTKHALENRRILSQTLGIEIRSLQKRSAKTKKPSRV